MTETITRHHPFGAETAYITIQEIAIVCNRDRRVLGELFGIYANGNPAANKEMEPCGTVQRNGSRQVTAFRLEDFLNFVETHPEIINNGNQRTMIKTSSATHRIVEAVRQMITSRMEKPKNSAVCTPQMKRVQKLRLDYIYNEKFDHPNAGRKILAQMPKGPSNGKKQRPPPGLPAYLASLYEVPLLTREQEYHLFRKYNYLKHKAAKLRDSLNARHPSQKAMDEIEQLYAQAVKTRNEITRANLRLVVPIAKRYVRSMNDFDNLISDGNKSLCQAVEKFDYARGNKFSTYATWAIKNNFARTIADETKHDVRFQTGQADATLDETIDYRADQNAEQDRYKANQEKVAQLLANLDERERAIIEKRFGLGDPNNEPMTLQEVGAKLGVTKERIRQIEAHALQKLRDAAAGYKVKPPEE